MPVPRWNVPAISAAGAFERAAVVRRAVRDLAIPHSGSSHGVVTISAGVTTLTAGAGAELRDLAGLILSADVALYQAKAKGRDHVVAAATQQRHGTLLSRLERRLSALGLPRRKQASDARREVQFGLPDQVRYLLKTVA